METDRHVERTSDEQTSDEQSREEESSEEQSAEKRSGEEQRVESMASAEDESLEPLFPEEDLAGHRARWQEIQAGFVDEPRQAVEQADALVADLLERVNAGFADARSRLEEQWGRGEEASTEDLRVALTRYRSFFNRLLAA
jgi:glutathione S-transferase